MAAEIAPLTLAVAPSSGFNEAAANGRGNRIASGPTVTAYFRLQ